MIPFELVLGARPDIASALVGVMVAIIKPNSCPLEMWKQNLRDGKMELSKEYNLHIQSSPIIC